MIIEWNAHMFSADTRRYPFHTRAAYVPSRSMFARPRCEVWGSAALFDLRT